MTKVPFLLDLPNLLLTPVYELCQFKSEKVLYDLAIQSQLSGHNIQSSAESSFVLHEVIFLFSQASVHDAE